MYCQQVTNFIHSALQQLARDIKLVEQLACDKGVDASQISGYNQLINERNKLEEALKCLD